MSLPPMHASRTPSGIELPDPDQGIPYIHVGLVFPSSDVRVWEPFDDGTEGGHNLWGFAERFERWAAGQDPWMWCREPRFGHPVALGRGLIVNVTQISIQYWRKEDVRAGHRGLAVPGQPGIRRMPDGSLEISVPR